VALVVLLGANVLAFAAADVDIRAVRDNRPVAIHDGPASLEKLIALVQSCSVDSTLYAVSSTTWAQTIASGAFVHALFPEPRLMQLLSFDNPRYVGEILLPLPDGRWPDHIFIRSGGDTLSVTKCHPLALRDLVDEIDPELLTVEPYKELPVLPRKQ
jgi:hypothetical protein